MWGCIYKYGFTILRLHCITVTNVEVHLQMWGYIYKCGVEFTKWRVMWSYIYKCEATFANVGLHLQMWFNLNMWGYIYNVGHIWVTFTNVRQHL